jgi:hypothetical protein
MGFCREAEATADFFKSINLMPFAEFGAQFHLGDISDAVDDFNRKLVQNCVWLEPGESANTGATWEQAAKAISSHCLEGVVNQLKRTFDDEDDFEAKYGKTDTVEEVVELYVEHKLHSDVVKTTLEFATLYPQFAERIESLFDVQSGAAAYAALNGRMPEVTQILSKSVGSAIWDFFRKDSAYSGMAGNVLLERLLVQTESNDVLDIYLMREVGKSRYRHDGGVIPTLLYVEHKKLHFNYAYYTAVSFSTDLNDFLEDKLRNIISKKTGLVFENEEDGLKGEVLPHLDVKRTAEDEANVGGSAHSLVRIRGDVNAPAYIAFTKSENVSRLANTAEFKRLGMITSTLDHASLGFYGCVPKKFYVAKGSVYTESDIDIRMYADDLEGVTMLTHEEDASTKVATTDMMNSMGVAVAIIEGSFVNPAIAKVHLGGGHRKRHNPHTVTTWEPNDNTPFALSEVPDIRVLELFVPEGSGDKPVVFYVQSESEKWYEYNYSSAPDTLTPKQIRAFEVCGAVDSAPLQGLGESYRFGTMMRDGYFHEQGGAMFLKNKAEELGRKIKTPHGGSYLSMQNDMRLVWDTLKQIPEKDF